MVWPASRKCWQMSGIALAILACCLVAPHQARASCGDYLMPRSGHDNSLSMGKLGGADHGQPESNGSNSHRPCSGPNCSNAPTPHAPLPLPTSTTQIQDFAVLFCPAGSEGPEPFTRAGQGETIKASPCNSSIFPPPRLFPHI